MNRKDAQLFAALVTAYANGEEIECHCKCDDDKIWFPVVDPMFDTSKYTYRVAKPAKKLRPYKFAEVPVGIVIRSKKSDGHRGLITGVKVNPSYGAYNKRELIMSIGANKQVDENELLMYWVKLDGSPLGILE